MELRKSHIALCVSCTIIGGLIGAGIRSCTIKKPQEPEPTVIHDTLTVRDTLRITQHTKPREIVRHDTIWFSTTDTLQIPVEIPITQSEYSDEFVTDSSRIRIGVLFSGYDAKIDSIGLDYTLTPKIRKEVVKRGWGQFIGIGVGVGYGASVVNKQVYAAPEVGLHITYGWGYHW